MKILILDDNKDFLGVCSQYLKRFDESADITTLSDPKDLIVKFTKNELSRFDVIISDYQMNNLDGVLINKYLKTNGITTPFILVSSYDYVYIRQKYSYQMCDYFIQKGIIVKDFCQEIVNCITKIRNQHDDAMIGTKAIFSNNLNFESKQII